MEQIASIQQEIDSSGQTEAVDVASGFRVAGVLVSLQTMECAWETALACGDFSEGDSEDDSELQLI
jgi:hypothetical protein